MTDKQRLALWLLFLIAVLAVVIAPAYACHRFSVWKYPYPQRCSVRVAQREIPAPPPKPLGNFETKAPEKDIPLPGLENDFPPDCTADWCQRLKGIGLLREHFGTN